MTIKTDKQDIRIHVRERYGNIAESVASGKAQSCCGPETSDSSCGCGTTSQEIPSQVVRMYETPDVADLPAEVTDLSLGCGDPVTLASLTGGQTVLDLGSGGGIDCFLAAKRVGSTGRVIGVDMTPAMLEQARKNKEKLGAENVEFRLGEIEHLPVSDNTVDVIISNCVINLSPDKPQVFREAFRVLKPGGRIAVSDIVTDGPLPDVVKESLSAWAGCVAGALDIQDYVSGLENAGFIDVEWNPVFLDKETVDDAVVQLDLDEVLVEKSEDLYKSVFSAKITAYKPSA